MKEDQIKLLEINIHERPNRLEVSRLILSIDESTEFFIVGQKNDSHSKNLNVVNIKMVNPIFLDVNKNI